MLTKHSLENLKQTNISEIYKVLRENTENRDVLFVLENLGYLPSDFDGDVLVPLLSSSNDQIRYWAAKNLGKLKDTVVTPKSWTRKCLCLF